MDIVFLFHSALLHPLLKFTTNDSKSMCQCRVGSTSRKFAIRSFCYKYILMHKHSKRISLSIIDYIVMSIIATHHNLLKIEISIFFEVSYFPSFSSNYLVIYLFQYFDDLSLQH